MLTFGCLNIHVRYFAINIPVATDANVMYYKQEITDYKSANAVWFPVMC